MIGLLILAGELVRGSREKVRVCETQPPTPETGVLPSIMGHQGVTTISIAEPRRGSEVVKSLNR